MSVWYSDPDDDLQFEQAILGDLLCCKRHPEPADVQVMIVHQTDVNREFIKRFPQLKGIVRLGVGYDKVDLQACRERGIQVANIPDYCTTEVADTTLAMMLDLVRAGRELEANLRLQPDSWQQLSVPRVRRASSLTLGVVGAGRIGSAVLHRATAFGFDCLFYDPAVHHIDNATRKESLQDLLQRSDIVSLHVPLQADTECMVNAWFLQQLKPGAILINTARGKLIGDEQLILDTLIDGRLGALALDVLPCEPPGNQPLFHAWKTSDPRILGRLIIQPHNAFYSQEAALDVRQRAAEEALRCLNGTHFLNPVC